MDDHKDDKKNIIHFPKPEKKSPWGSVKKSSSSEDLHRKKYRAEQARILANTARMNASGKVPMVNWERVPIFTRIALATFLIIQIALTFFVGEDERLSIFYHYGFVPALYTGHAEWFQTALIAPITTLFLHGNWMHLIFNAVMMMAMGIFFEREFGTKRTALFFLLCGIAGNIAYFLISPTSAVPVCGASGAISGLFGVSMIIMIERGMVGVDAQRRGALPFILLWSTIIIGFGMLSRDVAWQSHIGGFLGGIGLFQLWKKGIIRF